MRGKLEEMGERADFKSVTKCAFYPEKCDTFDCKFQVNLKIPEFCDRKV